MQNIRAGAACLAVLALLGPADAATLQEYGIWGSAGPEYDSNALRGLRSVTTANAVDSALLRLVIDGRASLRLARHLIDLSYGLGAKVFLREAAEDADELVQRAAMLWRWPTESRWSIALAASYYDAFQRRSLRDFRTGSASLGLARTASLGSAGLELGYQGLEFKPLTAYSYQGIFSRLRLVWIPTIDRLRLLRWAVNLAYTFAYRDYRGLRQRLVECTDNQQALCSEPGFKTRRDFDHLIRLGVRYVGEATLSIWYAVERNHSNSAGEGYLRQVVGLRFTTPMFWGLYLTAKGVLQLSRYDEPFFVSPLSTQGLASIDDENRSTLIVHLSRDLSSWLSLSLRYSLYLNESQAAVDRSVATEFRRHLLFCGLRFHYEGG